MKFTKLIICCLIIVVGGILNSNQLAAQTKPNIIVFLVDDMGWMDTSVPFGDSVMELNRRFHTPNMERLAKQGMKFANAYSTPVCSPTRISLLTGMNAAHHGVTTFIAPEKQRNEADNDNQFAAANWNNLGLTNKADVPRTVNATTYPQLLKENGYFTIHVGKAHWGPMGSPGANPYNFGFMVNIAGHAAGSPQSYRGQDNFGNILNRAAAQAVPDLEEYFGTDTFLTEALTIEAIKSLDAPIRNKQPFYLNMAHYAVHEPIQADLRFYQKYLDAGIDSAEARYASLVEGMDKSLGDLMNYLKKKGVEKNTVIIFVSDNGGYSYAPPRGGKRHTHNLPLKAGKGSMYEGGIRVPMIVSWPAVIKPSTFNQQPVIVDDFFPTILEIAGIKNYKTIQTLDGQSFLPLLKNPVLKIAERPLLWHMPNKWQPVDGPAINYHSAIRLGDWKLVYPLRTGKAELYNIKNDIGESNDLAGKYPDIVKKLVNLLSEKLQNFNAPMPMEKATGKQLAWPRIIEN